MKILSQGIRNRIALIRCFVFAATMESAKLRDRLRGAVSERVSNPAVELQHLLNQMSAAVRCALRNAGVHRRRVDTLSNRLPIRLRHGLRRSNCSARAAMRRRV